MEVENDSKMMFYIGGSGGAPTPPHPSPFTRPSASCAAGALRHLVANDNKIMLGGGALPPLHPPLASASGLVRRSSASPFRSLRPAAGQIVIRLKNECFQ